MAPSAAEQTWLAGYDCMAESHWSLLSKASGIAEASPDICHADAHCSTRGVCISSRFKTCMGSESFPARWLRLGPIREMHRIWKKSDAKAMCPSMKDRLRPIADVPIRIDLLHLLILRAATCSRTR